jgi:hypothetical protein
LMRMATLLDCSKQGTEYKERVHFMNPLFIFIP